MKKPECKQDILKLYLEIEEHLYNDETPSVFLNEIKERDVFGEYPFIMLKKLISTEQSSTYHPEGSVWNHTLMVVDEAASIKHKSKEPRVLMMSALLHDIGKPATIVFRKGRITSYNHDKVGARLAASFLRKFIQDEVFIDKVAGLVNRHMQVLYVIKGLTFAELEETLQETDIEELGLLCLCDRLGRGNVDRKKETQNIEFFLSKLYTHI